MTRHLLSLLSSLAIALALPASAARADKLKVVTSIETFAAISRAVGGDKVSVEALSKGYQDPHFVEAKPSLLVTLAQADLLVYVGLELEKGWLPPLVTNSRNPRIQPGANGHLDASAGITALDVPGGPVTRAEGDIHPLGNPHYWVPPVNALRVAKEISDRLAKIDPANAAVYEAGLKGFAETLKSKAPEWSAKANALKGMKVVSYHKSFSYVSQWLGLVEVGYVEDKPGIPADPQHLAQLIQSMKAQSVKALLVESYYNRSTANMVAEKAGAKVLVLPSDVGATGEIKAYADLVDAVLNRLADGK
ncbi:MAG: metal ABC transporter substrate-binding protein [Myxococcales bacterium]